MMTPQHEDILNMLKRRYDGPIMNNVYRGDYVECMIESVLGPDWRLTWAYQKALVSASPAHGNNLGT